MKYHGHEIIRKASDLGADKQRDNAVYEIYRDGKYIQVALTVSTAKEYIDSGYNENYL